MTSELKAWGISICDRTVAHLLKGLGYALRLNQKTVSEHCAPEQDEQFEVIAAKRRCCPDVPLISVDTKKKELIGRYRNPGAKWGRKAEQVNDHDFRSLADGLAVPYGIYDLHANAGSFQVGRSYDTPQFAVDCIVRWWLGESFQRYGEVGEMIILADAGRSNGYRCRAWKYFPSTVSSIDSRSRSPSHTTPRAPRNGTRLNTGCSTKCPSDGLAFRWRALRQSCSACARLAQKPHSPSLLTLSKPNTAKVSRSLTSKWLH